MRESKLLLRLTLSLCEISGELLLGNPPLYVGGWEERVLDVHRGRIADGTRECVFIKSSRWIDISEQLFRDHLEFPVNVTKGRAAGRGGWPRREAKRTTTWLPGMGERSATCEMLDPRNGSKPPDALRSRTCECVPPMSDTSNLARSTDSAYNFGKTKVSRPHGFHYLQSSPFLKNSNCASLSRAQPLRFRDVEISFSQKTSGRSEIPVWS